VLLFSIDCSTFSGSTFGGFAFGTIWGHFAGFGSYSILSVFWMCGSAIVVGFSLAHFVLLRGYQMLLLCRYVSFFAVIIIVIVTGLFGGRSNLLGCNLIACPHQ
jgi:hypothetical protein